MYRQYNVYIYIIICYIYCFQSTDKPVVTTHCSNDTNHEIMHAINFNTYCASSYISKFILVHSS